MQFSTLFTVASVFALTLASPVEISARQVNANSCAPNQEFHCCNQSQSNSNSQNGIANIAGALFNIGVNCAVMVNSCNSQQTQQCCTPITNQSGQTVNVC